MRSDNSAGSKFNRVCTDFPNISVLPKSATPGDIQVMYAHESVGNKFLGKTVTDFTLSESIEVPTVISIDTKSAFVRDCENICLPTT